MRQLAANCDMRSEQPSTSSTHGLTKEPTLTRKKASLLKDLIDLVPRLPWWIGAVLAVAS